MAAFITAAAGACSPECAAALAASPFSIPVIAAIGIATAVGFVFSQTKEMKDTSTTINNDESANDSTGCENTKTTFVKIENFL